MNRRKLLKVGMGAAALSVLPVRGFAQDATPPVAADDPNALLVGTALDLIPEGEPDEVSIVLQSGVISDSVAVVIRNNTAQAVEIDDVVGSIRDSSGTLLGKTGFVEIGPKRLEPNGGIALGRVFLDSGIPMDADVQLAVKLRDQDWFGEYISLPISELETAGGFVGAVENPTNKSLSYIEVVGLTFNPSGEPVGYFATYADEDELDLFGVAYWEASFWFTGQMSDLYLIGAYGR